MRPLLKDFCLHRFHKVTIIIIDRLLVSAKIGSYFDDGIKIFEETTVWKTCLNFAMYENFSFYLVS
jgi:hypothetical protein